MQSVVNKSPKLKQKMFKINENKIFSRLSDLVAILCFSNQRSFLLKLCVKKIKRKILL